MTTEDQATARRIERAGWTWDVYVNARISGPGEPRTDARASATIRDDDGRLLFEVGHLPDSGRCWQAVRQWLDDEVWGLHALSADGPVPLGCGGATVTVRAACMRRIGGALHVHHEERVVVVDPLRNEPLTISRPGDRDPILTFSTIGGPSSWHSGLDDRAEPIDGRLIIRAGDRDPIYLGPTGTPTPLDAPAKEQQR